MSKPGEVSNLIVEARAALLDALTALDDHRASVVVVGAQAVYLRCGKAPVALAEFTKDSDLLIDPRHLEPEPLLEQAMISAGFYMNVNRQPGAWLNQDGIPVDLMIPEALVTTKARRSAEVPPHNKMALRRAKGLEACVVDHSQIVIHSYSESDPREYEVTVAGAAALMVAKTHKLYERIKANNRIQPKDAHDFYRLLVETETPDLVDAFGVLLTHDVSRDVTREALDAMTEIFAAGQDAVGSTLAGEAEAGIGDPAGVAAATYLLTKDLIDALHR
jgi:hypothetical protein